MPKRGLARKLTKRSLRFRRILTIRSARRQRTPGEIAGLKVRRIINEPTAAALAYGLNKQKNEKIVVYDFGGGTFDISVLEMGDDTVEVEAATGGDTHLGGDDFDKKIQEYLVGEYKKQEGIDISKDPLALQRLKEAAEKAKHELSTARGNGDQSSVHFFRRERPEAFSDEAYAREARVACSGIYRSFHRSLTKETVTAPPRKAPGIRLTDIKEVILVGGQTRMPAMVEAVKKLFGKDPHQGINPDEVVALGAGVQAEFLQGDVKDILLA